ncbi:MAG TPA: LuxR C-terminal-related transcriptional regulator [Thermomicrobiales bacterium]|nr:LuxR C-terminal-related transcriptional regulator [Thermomicrobiales bacterium]
MSLLPRAITPLIGRERELQVVKEFLQRDDVALVTLAGTGGVGKTSLALSVAADLVDDFDDGVTFVSLAPLNDPALVASTLARALGVREAGGRSVVEALRSFLALRRQLLILDNFEHVLAAAPLVTDLLQFCLGIKVLATSRERLHLRGEQVFEVLPLGLPDQQHLPSLEVLSHVPSVQLFVERGREVQPQFTLAENNTAEVSEICRRLDGLPLALELAAAWIHVLPPASLLTRLERRLPLLTQGPRDVPLRQQTLRDAIGWSYHLLSGAEQRMFRRLAVFVGGFDLPAAEAIAQRVDGMESVSIVTSLVDKSLLRQVEGLVGEPRFGMLEMVREFGLERLVASGEESAIRQTHASYFLAFAENLRPKIEGPEGPVVLTSLENEHANLRAALEWEIEGADADGALRFVAAMWKFWWVRRHLSNGRALAERALALPGSGPSALRAEASYGAGSLAMGQADYAAAQLHGEAGLALASEIDDPFWTGMPLNLLGNAARLQGDYGKARARYEPALALYRNLGRTRPFARHAAAMVLVSLGTVAYAEGDLEEAIVRNQEALTIWRDRQDLWGQGTALINLGAVASRQGELCLAESHYRESILCNQTTGDRAGIGEGLAGLALVAASRGLSERAVRLFAAAEAIREVAGTPNAAMIPADRKWVMTAVKTRLGADAFAAEWETGKALTAEDAVAEAMEPPLSLPGEAPKAKLGDSLGLSGRELEILRLIAEGRSNRDIAGVLFISPRTVTTHTTGIFTKLDVGSRTAAVAVARERGLV